MKEAVQGEELVPVPPQDRWRLGYFSSLIRRRRHFHLLAMEDDVERTDELIQSLVVN